MSDKRTFRCASCAHVFEQEGGALRCPECRGRTLILLEGASLRGGKCGGNCGGCSGGCSCH